MWQKLKDKFDTLNSHASQLNVCQNFNQIQAQPGQTIEDYLAYLLRFQKTLGGSESAIMDETFKSHLLSILPKEYDNYVDIPMGLQSLPTGLCWHCGRGGHNHRDCSTQRHRLEAQRSDRGGRGNHQFAEVAHAPIISHALIVTCSHPGNPGSCYTSWLVDSGASQYMSPNRSDFLTLEPLTVQIKVYLSDDTWIPAVVQGKI
ncbi:hypothetical protein L873DRAFT_1129653 [Choiromyces venosus 120613-1]|uniref:CCHC-type domain-containing protein n=1 Tax=Choiromyces venosus 120613-1 TaxID=1336337 RepID=A0A3N4JGG6_9PEZI|nr:hypothetical protein L873DRAFT_1129653 [Choiromyces venosus 120613-1]